LDFEDDLENDLLISMGVNVSQNHSLRLVNAHRISGKCANHLNDVNLSIFHFDTDITLMLNDNNILAPSHKKILAATCHYK